MGNGQWVMDNKKLSITHWPFPIVHFEISQLTTWSALPSRNEAELSFPLPFVARRPADLGFANVLVAFHAGQRHIDVGKSDGVDVPVPRLVGHFRRDSLELIAVTLVARRLHHLPRRLLAEVVEDRGVLLDRGKVVHRQPAQELLGGGEFLGHDAVFLYRLPVVICAAERRNGGDEGERQDKEACTGHRQVSEG